MGTIDFGRGGGEGGGVWFVQDHPAYVLVATNDQRRRRGWHRRPRLLAGGLLARLILLGALWVGHCCGFQWRLAGPVVETEMR